MLIIIIVIEKVHTREKHLRSIGKRMPWRTADIHITHGARSNRFFFFQSNAEKGRTSGNLRHYILLYFYMKFYMMDATAAKHPDSRSSPDIIFLIL